METKYSAEISMHDILKYPKGEHLELSLCSGLGERGRKNKETKKQQKKAFCSSLFPLKRSVDMHPFVLPVALAQLCSVREQTHTDNHYWSFSINGTQGWSFLGNLLSTSPFHTGFRSCSLAQHFSDMIKIYLLISQHVEMQLPPDYS